MLSGKFKNCYGIKEFDMGEGINFTLSNKALIYAPNGVMKTSLTKVFEDLSKGELTRDRIFSDVTTSYSVRYYNNEYVFNSENLESIPSNDKIYVINSFTDNFEFTKDTVSTLLADDITRKEYNDLTAKFMGTIKVIEAELARRSGFTKPKVKDALIADFDLRKTADWPDIINAIHNMLMTEKTIDYLGEIKLAVLFNEKAVKEYEKPEFRKYIQKYIDRLRELFKKSELLTSDFTDRSAEILTKSFSSNNLFSAHHRIILRNGTEIQNVDEWKAMVDTQIQHMYNDEALHIAFEELKKNLTANNDVDSARRIIVEYRQIIPLLFEISKTKKRMWAAYCSQMGKSFNDYYNEITQYTIKVQKLYERAATQSERWQHVVEEFNRRFRVPFIVKINNKSNYILKDEAPNLSFVYKRGSGDDEESADLSKDMLLTSLSMGEKRAMYLLYILFDMEKIRNQAENGDKHLVIADDIADSFDYKNKYAIIEYLSDLSKIRGIDLLILTHNFDFFRTVKSRLGIRYDHCYISQKDADGKISFKVFKYQKDFFKNVIISGINSTDENKKNKMLVASIPFYRNLAEYLGNDDDYLKMTCFLHIKCSPIDTYKATLADLWETIKYNISGCTITFGTNNYYDTVHSLAESILSECDDISLENKLIVSIASRLKAEMYLKKVLIANEGECVESSSNQTREWYEKAKPYLNDCEKRLMDDINLITPEAIHLNAFMYEPLIDVSIWTLNDIFRRVLELAEMIS